MSTTQKPEPIVLAATDLTAPQFYSVNGSIASAQPYLENAKHFGSIQEANDFAAELSANAPHPDRVPPFVAFSISAAAQLPGRMVRSS